MILITDEKRQAKLIKNLEWHRWFAWFPVTINYGDVDLGCVVCLEFVWRKAEKAWDDDGYELVYCKSSHHPDNIFIKKVMSTEFKEKLVI